jgi:hypothetical protein
LDRNGDGIINDGTEMFGNNTPQPQPTAGETKNGFLALAEYDDNGDKVIDESDAVFRRLRLWQDKNHDAISQPEELHTLSELGVAGISVAYSEARRVDEHGNSFRYRAAVYGTRGSHVGMAAYDVWLTGVIQEKPDVSAFASATLWQCRANCAWRSRLATPYPGMCRVDETQSSGLPSSNIIAACDNAILAASALILGEGDCLLDTGKPAPCTCGPDHTSNMYSWCEEYTPPIDPACETSPDGDASPVE